MVTLNSGLPQPAMAGGGNRREVPRIFPRTLDELRTLGRDFGEAAFHEVRWVAISVWLMNADTSTNALSNPASAVRNAVNMVQAHDRYHLGWPCWQGREGDRVSPVLDGLTGDRQREAQLVAAQTVADWEVAGCPWMDANRIKQAFLYLVTCPAFINKYNGPQIGADLANEQEQP